MLKKIGTEASLVSAIPSALKKVPAERGPFDVMAVEGIEGVFTKHLETLQEQIDKADVIKAEKVAAQGTAKEVLDATKAKESASEQGLKEAKETLSSLEAQHQESYRKTNRQSR